MYRNHDVSSILWNMRYMYKCVHMCIQCYTCRITYPPAPACQGPPGCEAKLFNTHSSVPFNIPSAGEVSAIWCPAGQQSGVVTGIVYPLDEQFTFHQACSLSLGRSRKSMKFQCMSNAPENHQNGVSRLPKVSKMRSQEVPEVIKITKKSKKWNLMKTSVFTILLRG